MKPALRQITSTHQSSFLIRKDRGESMVNNWHYHPEIELLYIKKSSGTWLIGDHIGHFKNGDVVLIGANLPHCFRHESSYLTAKDSSMGETICIKFIPAIFGDPFFNIPETKGIRQLLSKCKCGLKLTGKTKNIIAVIIAASPSNAACNAAGSSYSRCRPDRPPRPRLSPRVVRVDRRDGRRQVDPPRRARLGAG